MMRLMTPYGFRLIFFFNYSVFRALIRKYLFSFFLQKPRVEIETGKHSRDKD